MNHYRLARRCLSALTGITLLLSFGAQAKPGANLPTCTPQVLQSADMFNCVPPSNGVLEANTGPAETYSSGAAAFPSSWPQYGFDQRHNPVFPASGDPNRFPNRGVFWAAPLTGLDFLRAARASETFGNPEGWASRTGQFLGEVMGVSVASGIVYAQLGRHEVDAIDARTGRVIWRHNLVNVAGMGQTVVRELGGRPVVFITVGDAAFNIQNTIRFANGQEHDRGASFGAVVALDGVTGAEMWRFSTRNAARPAAIFDNHRLYVTTGAGEFFVLDAASGAQQGFTKNPGNGFAGLASPNWYETSAGRKLVIYGTIRPRRILAMDVTNPANPTLAWEFTPPNATANSPGDTPVAVDPTLGRVFTTVFSDIGGTNNLQAMAIDAATGSLLWNTLMGEGDNPPGFKASVPMIHDNVMYAGNTINQTFQALDAQTGAVLWVTDISNPDDPGAERPRGAAVYVDGKVIQTTGRHILTFDAASGEILNDFVTVGLFALFGVTQPVVVGGQMYLSSISGWVFAAPVDFVTTTPGFTGGLPPEVVPPPQRAEFQSGASPSRSESRTFPATWLYYAGGPDNNAVSPKGPKASRWQTALTDALPLSAPPLDEDIYGTEEATMMTHLAFGVGSGLAAARGAIYAGSDRFTIHALNARSGREIWRYRTFNANFGQPLVTPNTVIVGGGDQWTNLGGTGDFSRGDPFTVGASLQHLTGLDPRTGTERWTFYTGPGTSGMTPLYHQGDVLWVNGQGKVYAVDANSGTPQAPFMDADGNPVLKLGFNAISSANIVRGKGNAPDLMVVGTARPSQITAINLETAEIVWTQPLSGFNIASTGFAAVSPAVDVKENLVIGSVLIDADPVANTATILTYGLDGTSGAVVWTRVLGSGEFPLGFVAPTPVVNDEVCYFANPLDNTVNALETEDGSLRWQTPVTAEAGRMSWGPGVVVKDKLIQPVGPDLYTFDAEDGEILNWKRVGGSFTYNNPVVAGKTLYIGNSWGWVSAMPVAEVIGGTDD